MSFLLVLQYATQIVTTEVDVIQEFLEQSIRDSCEGLMIKQLTIDATYEIAQRCLYKYLCMCIYTYTQLPITYLHFLV